MGRSDLLTVLVPFLATLGIAAVLTGGLRILLLRLGKVDAPRTDRWHQRPVPRPGGPAIVATVLLGLAVLLPRPWGLQVWGLLIGGLFAFAVGVVDDLIDLPNPLKLTLLIITATIPSFFGVSFGGLPEPIGIPLAVLWILGITNAMNWLDNMDGLAAGVAAIAAGTLAVLSGTKADPVSSIGPALVAGASVGFLFFNFSPAKIFMGDSGSGFLGFSLAVLSLLGTTQHVANTLLALMVPVMVLSIPIFDTAVVTLARFFSGRRLFQGGTDHPSHRLVTLGLSERRAVTYLYGFSLLSAVVAFSASRLGVWTGLVLGGALVSGFVALGVVLFRVRVYGTSELPHTDARVVLWQAMHKKRLLEMVMDLVLICVAYFAAYLLRFEGELPADFLTNLSQTLGLVIVIKIGVLYLSGIYRGDWRYVGLLDLFALGRALTVASLILVVALFMSTRLVGHSRAALIVDWILSLVLLGGMRVSIRLIQEYFASQRERGKRALIVGAGQGGNLLLQELRNNPGLPYRPIGFIDDDPLKHGAVIRGLPVLGSSREIPSIVYKYDIEVVLIAAPSMNQGDLDRVYLICNEAGVPCRPMRPLLEPVED